MSSWSAPLDPLAQWNVTDLELLNTAVYRLLENNGIDAAGIFTTEQFTVTQFINSLNDRVRMFLDETGAIVTRVTQDTTPQVPRYALPPDWIATRRVTWKRATDVSTTPATVYPRYALFRSDTYQLDQGQSDWMYNFDLPVVFSESALPTLQMELADSPSDAGTLGLNYTAQPVPLTGVGIKLAVPDEYAPGILYGALADLLSSDGAGKDLMRANYCEMRYRQTIELAKLLMEGV